MEVDEPQTVPETPASEEPAAAPNLADQMLDEEDRRLVLALRKAGLLAALEGPELLRVASEAGALDPEEHRVELLELYYAADGDLGTQLKRRRQDRFFLQRAGAPATAGGVVERLSALFPELDPPARLEKGDAGVLHVRAGEHASAVFDDEGDDETTTTVRSLVRAFNRLLDKIGARQRLMALRTDPRSEAYVGVGLAEAVGLCQAGLLLDTDSEELMDLGAW